jgi:hypothetical protein
MYNTRAWLYWQLRESLDPANGDNIMLPPDPELKADLCAVRWKFTVSGVQAESKEEIFKRLHRSTDKGDAVTLARIVTEKISYIDDDEEEDLFETGRSAVTGY